MFYRPDVAPDDEAARAAFHIYSTLLGGSMGSRLFDEIREQRGLAYSVFAVDHVAADHGVLLMGAGLDSTKCVEAYTRMREIVAELRDDGPTEEEVERARAYAAGRRVLGFENTNAVARYAAGRAIVHHEDIDPDASIADARRGDVRRRRRDRAPRRPGRARRRVRRPAQRGRLPLSRVATDQP